MHCNWHPNELFGVIIKMVECFSWRICTFLKALSGSGKVLDIDTGMEMIVVNYAAEYMQLCL